MAEKDYYKVLGVDKDASQEDIRKAYRNLAKKHHPDRQGGSKAAEEKFKEISDAYSVLGDPEKRKQYDQLRSAGMRGGSFGGGPGGPGGAEGFEDIFQGFSGGGARPGAGAGGGGFSDLFSKIFGGAGAGAGRREAPRRRGADVNSSITIPFEKAVNGSKVQVTIGRQKPCPACNGTGAGENSRVETCPHCHGTGEVNRGQGNFTVSRPCPSCFGRGRIIQQPCTRCHGAGSVEAPSRVEVNIPKGIRDGQKLRLAGMGQPGSGGAPAGDLLVEVHVAPHPVYERKGRDIYTTAPVGMADAALGTQVDVQTLQGEVSVKVPPGTQPGQKLRVPGYGLETSDGRKGDHYVKVQVVIPKNLTDEQRRLLERLRKAPAATS
jgi:molecular chaperone DnaJ